MVWLVFATSVVASPALEESRLYRTAKAAFGDGLYEVSAGKWNELFQKFPKTQYADEGRLFWAESLVHLGKPADASKLLEERLSAPMPLAEKWLASYVFWSAEAHLALNETQPAAQRYRQFLKEWPNNSYRAAALYGLAVASFKLQKLDDADSALRDMRETMKKTPMSGGTLAKEAAEEMARQSALLQGEIWLARGSFAEAAKEFDALTKQNPTHKIRLEAMRWTGELLARQGKLDEATQMFRAVLDAKDAPQPLKAEVWLQLGSVLQAQKKFKEAAGAYGEAFKLNPADDARRQALVKRARCLVDADQRAAAVEELRAFSENNSKDTVADSAQLWAADLLYEGKNFAEALKSYRALCERFPESPHVASAHHRAGWCLLELKEDAKSVAEFSLAAKASDPRIAEESQIKLADTFFALKQYGEASAAYVDFLKRFPASQQCDAAQYQNGVSLAYLNRAEEAVREFSAVSQRQPPGPLAERAAFEIGRTYSMTLDAVRARASYEKFLTTFGGGALAGEAKLAAAQTYYNEGKFDEAIQKLEAFLQDAPETLAPRAMYDFAWCHFQVGDVEKALATFAELVKKYVSSPQAAQAQAWIADYYFRQKDYVKAKEQFLLLADKDRFPASGFTDTALYMAGRSLADAKDYTSAIQVLERVLKEYPDSRLKYDAQFLQADCHASLTRYENAIALFEIVIGQTPDTPIGLSALGRKGDCLFAQSKYDDAAKIYARLVESGKADAEMTVEARYKIAKCLEKQDKTAEAFAHYADVVYGWLVDERDQAARNDTWFCRAAFDGASNAELRNQPRDALRLLERVVSAGASMKAQAEAEIRRIKVANFDLR